MLLTVTQGLTDQQLILQFDRAVTIREGEQITVNYRVFDADTGNETIGDYEPVTLTAASQPFQTVVLLNFPGSQAPPIAPLYNILVIDPNHQAIVDAVGATAWGAAPVDVLPPEPPTP